MLILSRYKDERIFIGDDIVITIVDLRGGRARIGIDAPKSVQIQREEVRDRMRHERGEARDE